jgi:hypothetical protein
MEVEEILEKGERAAPPSVIDKGQRQGLKDAAILPKL